MASEFEERETAVFAGYRWDEWTELHPLEKAATIAHYRLRGLVHMHQQDAAEADRERKTKKR